MDHQEEIRNAAERRKGYMRELRLFEVEIKRKDLELSRQKLEKQKELLLKQRPSTHTVLEGSTEPIHSADDYDYDDDDDNDLNNTLEEECLDAQDEIPALEDDDDDVQEMEEQIRKQKAQLEKERGNMYLVADDVDEAIICYTRGITLDGDNPLIYANRALAFLKKQQYTAAEKDCDTALILDPKYAKALLRRAASRSVIGKLELARNDLLEVLQLEPNNSQAKQELEKVDKVMSDSGPMTVMPIDKPPHLRSKVPLRRIQVVPIADDTGSNVDPQPMTKRSSTTDTTTTKPNVPIINPMDLTSYQFQKDFRQLKCHPDVFYDYIKKIPAQRYPQLFQHSLESDVLSHLLRSYRDFFLTNGDNVYPLLLHLSKTQRFATIRMFLSSEDQRVLCDLFDKLLETNHKDDVKSLKSAYGMQ